MAFACLTLVCAAAPCGASVLQVTADSTWTEAKQSEINASDGIEIASGATLTLNVGSGATLSIAKVISGGGNLVKDGAGRLDLSGENTFTGEFTVGGTGAVYAYSDGAFGSSAGKTVLYEHLYTNGAGNTGAVGANLYLCGITTSEPIKIVTSDKKAYLYAAASTVNVLNGQLELEGSQASVYALANATLYIRGGIVGVNDATFRPNTDSGAKLIVEDLPSTAKMWNAIVGKGQFILNTAGNAGGYTWHPITCGVDWAFNGAALSWRPGGSIHMKVDLGGHSQRVADISAADTMNGYVTSADKAFLYVADANANRTSYLPFKGKAGLFFEGTGKTTLYAESETAGDLTVTNGTVAFAAAAGWGSVDAVTVSGKGRLELSAPRQIGIGAAVALADEGVLKTADNSVESVRSLSINGVQMPEGVSYGGADSDAENKDYAAFFEGTGALFVQVQAGGAATWDGGAGSDDFSAAANWVGDPADIDLTHGQTMATFAMPGTTRLSAILDADAALYGIVFDDVPSFAFTGTGTLRLGAGGLRAPAAADLAPRDFTIGVPLRLSAGDNRWDIGSNVTVRVSSLASDANTALSVHSTGKESGRLVLDGANAGFMGVLLLSNVITRVSGNDVFGSSAAGTTIYAQDAKEGGFTNAVELCGTTNSEPFKVVCDNNGQYAFLAKKGTRNVFNGPVDFEVASMKLQLESNSEVVFAGGGASDKLFRPKCASNSRVVITNTPVNWNGLWSDGGVGEIVFSVASNKFDGSFYSPMPIRCTVPYARYQGNLNFNAGGGVGTKLELDGNDQRFNRLFATRKLEALKAGNAGGINSETPATVYLDDTEDGECEACFSGAVSLVKEGAHTLTLNWRSTSTGTVTITNGTLRFAVLADTPNLGTICGSWSNATAFVVRDAGRLEAKHGGVFGAGTDILLDGANARIELADGTIQRVGEVVLDGKHGIRCVTYGGPASSAKIKDSRISGTGMLWATKGLPGGFIINFR